MDKKSQLQYTSKLMRFVQMLMKMPTAKPIKLKTAVAPQQKNSGAVRNMGLRQVQAAKMQIAQQKFMKDFTATKK